MSDAPTIDFQSYGPDGMAERDLCVAVGEDLTKHYPGYDWMVGANVQAGTVVIDLMCEKPLGLENHGYLLHIPNLLAPGGHERVMRAGGELLERFGLPRSAAPKDWQKRAEQNGLDTADEIKKSRF